MSDSKDFAGLTNQEIVIIHDKFKEYLDSLNSKLEKNMVYEKMDTPMGEGIKVHKLTDEQVEEFKNHEYYKCSESIVQKLGAIKDLIIDSAPEELTNISE